MRTLILGGLLALPVTAQDNSWRKEIDNNLVRVVRRLVAPRETVSAAGLPPALLVFLADYSVRLTTAAQQEELRGNPDQFFWHSGGRIVLENLSEHRLEVVQVAPKFSPGSQELAAALGRRTMVFENDLIHVRHLHLAPGRIAASPLAPEHLLPAVVIQLSSAHIRLTHAGGRIEEFRMKAGDIRFEAGGGFSFENLGDSVDVLRIILKPGERDRN